MKRRLALRDRLVWVVAVVAIGVVAYLVVPIWVLVAALALAVGVPLVIRRSRRPRARR